MNKPIVAYSFEEMNKLDSELVNDIPLQKRNAAWKKITELFANSTSAASQNQRRRLSGIGEKMISKLSRAPLFKICMALSEQAVEYIIAGGTAV